MSGQQFDFNRHREKTSPVACPDRKTGIDIVERCISRHVTVASKNPEIHCRVDEFGYLEPGETVYRFLKHGALCDMLNEIAFFSMSLSIKTALYYKSWFSYKYASEASLSEDFNKNVGSHFFLIPGTNQRIINAGFHEVPVYPYLGHAGFRKYYNQWAQRVVLGSLSENQTEADLPAMWRNGKKIPSFSDLRRKHLLGTGNGKDYNFREMIRLYNSSFLPHKDTVRLWKRKCPVIFNMFLGSTPDYSFNDLCEFMGNYIKRPVFLNMILLGSDFEATFIKDIEALSEECDNVSMFLYATPESMNDRTSYWNNEKLFRHIMSTRDQGESR